MHLSPLSSISREELINLHDILYNQRGNFSQKYTEPCLDILTEIFQGKKIHLIETEFAAAILTLKSFGITFSDEVIISPQINPSFVLAISALGAIAKPISQSFSSPNFKTSILLNSINSKTKAIVLDYHHGVMPELDEIIYLSAQKGIHLLEYSTDGLGSFYKYNSICSFGHIGIISFNQFKSPVNLGCALIINDSTIPLAYSEDLIQKSEITHSDFKSAILLPYLREIDTLKECRKEIWMTYFQFLQFLEEENRFRILGSHELESHNFSGISLFFDNPQIGEGLHQYLLDKQVESSFHSTNFEFFLDLPFHVKMNEEEILRITLYVNEFFGNNDSTDPILEIRKNFLEDFDL